ncbi:hypothetical protein NL676_027900 [Syzygium grande]|nr:hypothetical protein NL676_027900 [Syzygium grande]
MSGPAQIPRRKRTALESQSPPLASRLVDFANKVKIRFPRRPDVFAAFCEACSLCEEKGEEWVFGRMRDLFADHQDLIAEFAELHSKGSALTDGAEGSGRRAAIGGLGNELTVLNTGEKPEIEGGEPRSSFPAPVKNAHERILFDCEDDMCDLDVMIGLVRSAISRIGRHLAAGRCYGCRLTAGELRCIRNMYGDQGADMVELLREDPERTLPLVLSRLQQKHDQWMAYRSDARKVWKKAFAEHHRPSLGRGDTRTITIEAPVGAGSGSCPLAEAPENVVGVNVRLNLFSRSQCGPMRLMAVMNFLNNEDVSDIYCLRLVMLYALRCEKESPVQLMQLFNKLAARSAKYKPGGRASVELDNFHHVIIFIQPCYNMAILFLWEVFERQWKELRELLVPAPPWREDQILFSAINNSAVFMLDSHPQSLPSIWGSLLVSLEESFLL